MNLLKKWKIVTDTGSSIKQLTTANDKIAFDSVPLMINIEDKVYIDDETLDLNNFLNKLSESKSQTSSACSSPEVYANHFTGAENIICFTISSNLSGSYNSANLGKTMALENNPEINIHIFDTLTAGSEADLLIYKALELAEQDVTFEEMVSQLNDYHENLDTAFLLESVQNLVNNGRVSKLVGQMVGLLGIRLVGNRTAKGEIQLAHKSKGKKRGLKTLYNELIEKGYKGGKIQINHVLHPEIAEDLKELVLLDFPNADIAITTTSALCSYYAEHNGMIIGYETN